MNPADLHAEGNARGARRARPDHEVGREASSTRSPAVDPDHEVCRDDGGARNGQPPAQAAPSRVSGGAVAEAGAVSPSGATRREGAEAMAFGR